MSFLRCRDNDRGASVIIGTLVLILVVVIGAASIGLMMSTAQKQEMNRQAHETAVKNEKLDIERLILVPNTTTPERWAFINFTIVNLNINDATVTIIGLYDQQDQTYRYPKYIMAGSSPSTMAFYEMPATYQLRIPGSKSLDVSLNLSNFSDSGPGSFLQTGDEVRINLYTSLLNNFEKRFVPPTPLMTVKVATEDLGIAQRDYLHLDGTGSTDDGSITNWNWTVKDGNTGNLSFYEGKIVDARISSPGPFTINLTVTDNMLMKSTSDDYRMPANPRFNPPTALNVTWSLPVITARVTSIDGSNVSSVPIDFLIDANPGGNITLSVYSALTGPCGCASTTVSGGPGRIKVISGNLPPVYIPLP